MSACLGAVAHAWYESRLRGRAHYVVHNLVAHPLLVLWPRAGTWLHDRTDPGLPRTAREQALLDASGGPSVEPNPGWTVQR